MKVKTSELTGPALGWAVAKCLYPGDGYMNSVWIERKHAKSHCVTVPDHANRRYMAFRPTADQQQCGEIIDREGISTWKKHSGWWQACFYDVNDEPQHMSTAHDRRTAAMRCFVLSRLGDEVDIPEELL